ncbi:MAG: hypothetical protein AB1649_34195, partial [Chloroflexota bacterium]
MRVKYVLFVVLIAAILSACGRSTSTATVVPTAIPVDTPVPTPVLTIGPTTPLAILAIPVDMDPVASELYQKTVYELAQASGYRFQVRNVLTSQDLTDPTLKVVIALPPDPGIAALAPTAPQVQFLAVNISGLTPGGNVSVLAGDSQLDIPSFLAGYTAALITDEYHIGMMIPQGSGEAQRAFNAFASGMKYYCGLCRTFYISPITYPQFIEVPADETADRYGGYANVLLNDRKVYTLFIHPDLAKEEFLAYVGTTGAMLIGTDMPDPRPGGWVMTIQPDTIKAIQNSWPNLIAGQGGINVQSPLGIADVDPGLLSPGRERLVQETLEGLLSGRISV